MLRGSSLILVGKFETPITGSVGRIRQIEPIRAGNNGREISVLRWNFNNFLPRASRRVALHITFASLNFFFALFANVNTVCRDFISVYADANPRTTSRRNGKRDRGIISGFVCERERKGTKFTYPLKYFALKHTWDNIESPFHPRYSIPFRVAPDDSRVSIACDRRGK